MVKQANNVVTLHKPTYPSDCRKMTKQEIEKYNLDSGGSTVLDVLWVPIERINVSNRKYQSRRKDSAPEKIKEYERDISSRGLKTILLVEYDSINECFVNITGYTRTQAALNLNWSHLPVAVIDVAPLIGEQLWNLIQQQNSHPPATPHSMDDAVYGLQQLKAQGHFANKSREQITKECTQKLKRFYPTFQNSKRTLILNRVFNWDITRTRQLGSGERKRLLDELYPKNKANSTKKELATSNVVYFHTDNSNAAKMLGNKVKSLCDKKEQLEQVDNEVWTPVKINVVVSIAARDSEKIPKARKEVMDAYKLMNKHGIQSSLGRVHEVTFAHQIEEPKQDRETENIKYRWNTKQKTFLKTSNKTKAVVTK